MRWIVAVVALVIAAGCAGVPRQVSGSIADMRKYREGLCAADDLPGTGGLVSPATSIVSCAQMGAPGTLADNPSQPFVVTKIVGWDFQTTNPGNFQVEVWRNGRLVLKQMLPRRVPEIGPCLSSGCMKVGISVIPFEPGWIPGEYMLRYTCSFNVGYVATTGITVTGSVSGASL